MIISSALDGGPGAVSSGFSPTDLLKPSAFPHPVARLELHETNISWVILTGLYAYKIKKSVQLGFLDSTTLAKRRFLCEEELRLNRRLCPEVYLDALGVSRRSEGGVIGLAHEAVERREPADGQQLQIAQTARRELQRRPFAGSPREVFDMRFVPTPRRAR